MKLDMDLVRPIGLAVEVSAEADGSKPVAIEIEGVATRELSYHAQLMHEAGLIEAANLSNARTGPLWLPKRLTYQGHEFIAAARDEPRWRKALRIASEQVGAVTIDMVTTVLKELALKALRGS